MKNKKVQYLTLLLGCILIPLTAQESPLLVTLPEKDALFAAELGDLDVDLFVGGTWKVAASGSVGISYRERTGLVFPVQFPLMQEGFLFRQVPDLTLSLWMAERWFFETTMKGQSDDNTFLMGYVGKEGEFVRSVLAGNRSVALSPYRYLDFPEADRRSPGVAALFETDRSSHEFLLRYDPSALVRKTFIGGSERVESFIPLSDYVAGRFFLLPDRNADDLVLYLEDGDGTVVADDGRRYRRADGRDFFYDAAEGSLTLRSVSAGRVLVFYRVGGVPVGGGATEEAYDAWTDADPSVGRLPSGYPEDVASMIEPLDGRECLVLHEPGRLYPFQVLGRYPLPAGTAAENAVIRITSPSGESTSAYEELQGHYRFLVDSDSGVLTVLRSGTDRGDAENRYPFLAEDIADLSGIYRADERFRSPSLGISVEALRTAASYRIEGDPVPGSVQVYRNGRPERGFQVDYASGAVSFDVPPRQGEEIEVIYRTYDGASTGGDLLLGTGHRIFLSDLLTLELAGGLRWNVQEGAYAEIPDGRPGLITASAALFYRNERLRWEVDGALSYYAHNTTGILRLLGMEGEGIAVPAAGAVPASPAAVPLDDPSTATPPFDLDASSRGVLFYRDYRNADGSYASWSAGGKKRYPYETGSIPGPYPAASGADAIDGTVTVMEYELADGEWAGIQLPFSSFGSADLSRIEAVTFRWIAADEDPEALRAFLQIGSVSEDLDGDGMLDEELNRYSSGFAFDHDGTRLLVGGGPDLAGDGIRDGEDADLNGILSRDTPSLIVTQEIPSNDYPEPGSWKRVTVRLSPAQRAQLTAVRGIRLLLANPSGSTRAGRIVVSPFELEGSPFSVSATDADDVFLREIPEGAADPPAPRRLANEISESARVFGSDGDAQRVLQLSWGVGEGNEFGADGFAEITGFTEPVPLWQYRELSLYIRVPELLLDEAPSETAAVTIALTDGAGRGVQARFELDEPFSDWRKITVDLADRRILLNGVRIPGTVAIDRNGGDLARFALRIDGSGAGTLFLDEVHLSDAVESYRADSSFALAWDHPGDLLNIAGLPVLSNLVLSEAGTVSGTFRGENPAGASAPADFSHTTDIETDLFALARIGGSLSVRRAGGEIGLSAGHRVAFPAESDTFSVSDAYHRSYGILEDRMERKTALSFRLLEAVALRAATASELRDERLLQTWDCSLVSVWKPPVLLDLTTRLSQTADGYFLTDAAYSAAWIDSYSLIGRWDDGRDEHRSGRAALDTDLATRPVGAGMDVELSFRNFPDVTRSQENAGSFLFEIPLSFGDGPGSWNLTLGYERLFSHRYVPSGGEEFADDLTRFGEMTARQEYLYSPPPVGEIFSSNTDELFSAVTEGLARASYRPAVLLAFGRQAGSDIVDLFAPSSALFRLGKSLERDEDTVTSTLETSLSLSMTALNLFGGLGRYPVFPVYRTDEFRTDLEWILLADPDFSPRSWEFSLSSTFGLYAADGGMLLLSNRLRLWSDPGYFDEASLSWVWRTEPHAALTLPYLPVVRPSDYHYLHTETLTATGTGSEGTMEDEGALLRFGHETALRIPDRGSLRIYGRIGIGTRPVSVGDAVESQFIGGLEMGIEGEISF